MLHFIFNNKHICVLITYDVEEGEFVMQIPNFHHELLNEEECYNIINTVINKGSNDVDIVYILFFN